MLFSRIAHFQGRDGILRIIAVVVLCSVLAACASTTSRGMKQLEAGMTTERVRALLGDPDGRSFRRSDEAWQYHDVVGFGQCEYLTAWFSEDVLQAATTRRGDSIAGCGLGSRAVDWGQRPDSSIDVNVQVEE